MNNKVIVKNILGSELRSRMKVLTFRKNISFDTTLDFEGVEFMSRSFADELYNLRLEFPGIGFINMTKTLQMMFTAVSTGRQHKQKRTSCNKSNIETFDSLNDLNEYFNRVD